jgi:putative heme iron utilization protein
MNQQSATSQHQLRLARRLWFGSYHGILSTHSQAVPEYPFGSLVPFCRDLEGSPVLLLSHLAQHTCNLDTNSHCSLLLLEKGDGDVQQLGRLTCLAVAKRLVPVKPAISERFFDLYPDTRGYHEDLNFNFYRLKPVRFYFVGGFGQARWLDYSRLVPDCRLTEEGERHLRTHLGALARRTGDSTIKISGVDCLGMDLRIADRLERLMLEDPIPYPEALLQELKTRLIKMPSEFRKGFNPT